ncbi:MAG: peptidase T [Candidatus Lokiarchaeota archaeon]|nr:peptidase T [Candidatus Lokiarchaeota archaeon]
MILSEEIQNFLLDNALERFLRYVKIWTTSDENTEIIPSTQGQIEFGKLLKEELKNLNLVNIIQDEFGYIYANLPPSQGFENVKKIAFIAHLDTSPAVSGKDVKPVIHKNYNGTVIKFSQDNDLELNISDSPQLEKYIGLDIITSQGDTLLGADDKAGIAEIMAACAAWDKFPELKHGPIVVCFFPDEELGRGTKKVNIEKLPKICYTLDGSEMGELEIECFDAWKAIIKFKGLSVHPGYAKNLMINAVQIACRFLSGIPEAESPEHTEQREGYYHLSNLKGKEEKAIATLIIRDFEIKNNKKRMDYITSLKNVYEIRYPGLKIELNYEHQYENMCNYLKKEQKIIDLAEKAMELAGIEVNIHSIRGGTDGSHLSAMGIPTPNIFTGGLLFHSKKEFIPTLALQKAAEVVIHLAELFTKE